jgi:hypothetical protein
VSDQLSVHLDKPEMKSQNLNQDWWRVCDLWHHFIDFDQKILIEMIAILQGFGAESQQLKRFVLKLTTVAGCDRLYNFD